MPIIAVSVLSARVDNTYRNVPLAAHTEARNFRN